MDSGALSGDLLRVVNSTEGILRGVGAEGSSAPILAGGWSRRQVIGHLIDSASNNHQRFVRASLADSLEFPGYDQTGWSRIERAGEADWSLLVELWRATTAISRTSSLTCRRGSSKSRSALASTNP